MDWSIVQGMKATALIATFSGRLILVYEKCVPMRFASPAAEEMESVQFEILADRNDEPAHTLGIDTRNL